MTNRMGKRSMVTDAKKRSVDDIITVNNSSNNNNNSNGWPKQDSKRNKPKNRNKNNNKKLNNDIQKPSLSLLQLNNYIGRGETLQNFVHFVNYWWFRYLMVTELYMVERWERIVIHIILSILFVILGIFNYCILLSIIANIFSLAPPPIIITNIREELSPGIIN